MPMMPRRPSSLTVLAPLTCLLVPAAPLAAQHYQCSVPRSVNVPRVTPDAPPRPMPVTGYTLALSWSPEFCKPRRDSRAHATQCSGDNGRFGLVVHGLWPDGARGWPQWCPTRARPTPRELRENLCMMPSARLIARQWAKHGACMVRRPGTYLRITRILRNALRIPDYDRISREEGLTAGRIRAALADANPGLERDQVGVTLNARGWLREIRICYSARFLPTRCGARRFGARDAIPAKIWRGL